MSAGDDDDDDDEKPAAYARHSDPATSHEAAETVDVTRLESLVEEVHKAEYPTALTWKEVSEHQIMVDANVDRQSISPRFKPLMQKGVLETIKDKNGKECRGPGWKKSQLVRRWVPPHLRF